MDYDLASSAARGRELPAGLEGQRASFVLAALALLGVLADSSTSSNDPDGAPARPELGAAAVLGERIFHDPTLSASGRLSCASCHDEASAFAAPRGAGPVPAGGPELDVRGFRNGPSLSYAAFTPAFFFDSDGTPTGGFDRDGREDSLAAQAERPFLAAHEMANASPTEVVSRLSRAAYADDFRALFGENVLGTPEIAFERMLYALQQYEREDAAEFAPFTSKYDAFLAGRAQFSAQELRGLAIFNDPTRGNCASCHPSARRNGEAPLFTDFTYDNLGVPRNADIPANADPAYYDLGLCGPFRADVVAQPRDLCGAFKVPTLRNIALTAPYFHNGRFATLRETLEFYVQRDTNPEKFYPLDAGGVPIKFNDLPDEFKQNVNMSEAPVRPPRGRRAGARRRRHRRRDRVPEHADGWLRTLRTTMTTSLSRPWKKRLVICAAGLSAAVAISAARAATQQELEAKVDALSAQVAELRSELAALHAQGGAASSTSTGAAAASSADATIADAGSDAAGKVAWFGYGEISYSRPEDDGSATTADVARFVLGAGYRFDDRTRFVSELEVEHAVSSADDPGEVEIEQAYIERRFNDRTFGSIGLFLMPVGLLNENHEPTRYYGVFRNFVETAIIPTTWREGGFEVQGNTDGGLRWNAGISTGFDLSKWDATSLEGLEQPLGSIHQELALASAGDLAAFAAVNYTGVPGLRLGGSVFSGDGAQGQPGFDDNRVTLWEGHARFNPGNWDLSALYSRIHIANTAPVNTTLVGNPALIPEAAFGWYLEGAYRVPLRNEKTLAPFARYERLNTASSYAFIGAGLTPDPLDDTEVLTTGVNFYLTPGVVLKFDYLRFLHDGRGDRFDLGLGYQF